MPFSPADILNLLALLISMAGSFLMYFYSPDVSSKLYVRMRAEMPTIEAKDRYKNKMIRRGMLLLLIGFILQAAAIFLNVAGKK